MEPKGQVVCYAFMLLFAILATFWGAIPDKNWRSIHFGWAAIAMLATVLFVTAWKSI